MTGVKPRLLMTGGSGRLGRALVETPLGDTYDTILLSSRELDVTDPGSVETVLLEHRPDVVLHAAAWTDVRGAETQRKACWDVNVVGTRNVAAAVNAVNAASGLGVGLGLGVADGTGARSSGTRLVHVSTDYVFWGGDDLPEGGYREEDVPGPVRNHYALTKLVAEEAARACAGALVVRTSFRPSTWAYPKAFDDVFTSQDYVDVIAAEIATLLLILERVDVATLHIVTERKSIYDLAKRRNPHVVPGSKRDAGVDLPDDITLNAERWRALKQGWD